MAGSDRKKRRIIGVIPARRGSERLAVKNLALIDGKPMIFYSIKAAKESGVFDRVVLNSEDELFAGIARRYDVEFYKRPKALATSTAKSDAVIYDFVKSNPCDIIGWVNSIAPFQTADTIRQIVGHFTEKGLDSLITVEARQTHCTYKGRPINFSFKEQLAKTQDLTPVFALVHSLMLWRTDTFMRTMDDKGYALFCGKVGFYPVDKLSTIVIKKKEDILIADAVMRLIRSNRNYEVGYDSILKTGKTG